MSDASLPDRYAVLGHPVAHSQSPFIHAEFAAQTDQRLIYTAEEVPLEGFAQHLAAFPRRAGQGVGCGVNVTVPFKHEAWLLADLRSPRAERAGAVNTIVFRPDGTRFGDNTDGVGLIRDLEDNHGAQLEGARVLLLGAGGAAAGILAPLLARRPQRLLIANRTTDKARALATRFADLGPVGSCALTELPTQAFDHVLHASAAGLTGAAVDLPASILADGAWCYDLMYGPGALPFLRWAERAGAARVLDGLGMLDEQAAEAFFIWRGLRPQTAPVLAALRRRLQAVDAAVAR